MTAKARILFVDDEKRVLNAMRGLFRRKYELYLANSGADAMSIIDDNDIDVIVADQRMPGMTGIEVLAQIKKRSPRTVRILLTGYADPAAIQGSINEGEVFRFLSKPCPPNLLRETLALAVDASRTQPVAPAKPEPDIAPQVPVDPPAVPVPEASVPGARTTPAPGTAETIASEVSDPETPAEPEVPVGPAENFPDFDATTPNLALDVQAEHWQTVTSIVMTGDETSESRVVDAERRPQPVAAPETLASPHKEIGVVAFTVDSDFAASVIRAAAGDRETTIATTLVKVGETIREGKTGVLVTDFTTNRTILQKIINTLKQRMPELVTIVVNDFKDSTDMINLINYGQIYRYSTKPIEPGQLRMDINAAVLHHLQLRENPESHKRHHVVNAPGPEKPSQTLSQFLNRFRRPAQPAAEAVGNPDDRDGTA
ncbi:MAG: response regulator [Woeseiaceae bacterium]|nr:response regulator [Woeseiaceae bacterium]